MAELYIHKPTLQEISDSIELLDITTTFKKSSVDKPGYHPFVFTKRLMTRQKRLNLKSIGEVWEVDDTTAGVRLPHQYETRFIEAEHAIPDEVFCIRAISLAAYRFLYHNSDTDNV